MPHPDPRHGHRIRPAQSTPGGDVVEIADRIERMRAHPESLCSTRPTESEPLGPVLDEALAELSVREEEVRVANEGLRTNQEMVAELHHRMHAELARYRAHFDECPDGYVLTDVRGTIREANATVATMLGIRPPFLAGKPLIHFVARADCRAFRGALETLRSTGKLDGYLMRLRPRHHGQPFYVEVSARGARHGAELFARWVLRDVQTRVGETLDLARRLREAEAKLAPDRDVAPHPDADDDAYPEDPALVDDGAGPSFEAS